MFCKIKKVIFFAFIIFGIFFIARSSLASFVVINEIAWMGREEGWQKEWIELYNAGDNAVFLDDWKIESEISNSPKIELKGKIEANSYFFLERTSNETVPHIKADQIYTGNLNNNGEILVLINKQGKTLDRVDCSLGWFAGDNASKKTMERISPHKDGSNAFNWKNSNEKHGTPKAENSLVIVNQEKTISIVDRDNKPNSDFYFILTIAIFISICLTMLIAAILLKIKRKKDRI